MKTLFVVVTLSLAMVAPAFGQAWWTLPEGSSERAAAQQAARQEANVAAQRAAEAAALSGRSFGTGGDPEQKRPAGREAPREMTPHERDVLEWERNQAAIAEAKQAAFDKKLARRCDSVRSDQATPALVLQCQQLLGR